MFFLYLACATEPTEDVDILERPDDWGESDISDSDDLIDVDQDGFSDQEDCDDWNPGISPDASEVSDGIDNDCDGFEDWDGFFQAENLQMNAVGIYDGVPYYFYDVCSAWVERTRGIVEVQIMCSIDQSQERSNQLLGTDIVIEAQGQFPEDAFWAEAGWIYSTGGPFDWDSRGDVELRWSSLQSDGGATLNLSWVTDAIFLDLAVDGQLVRTIQSE